MPLGVFLVQPCKLRMYLLRRTKGNEPDLLHDDVIKWKHFSRYWPFVRGVHRSPVNSPHKGQWRGAFFYLRLNKRLSKQSWGWWFETPWRSLWRHCNVLARFLRNWWPVWARSRVAPSIHPEPVTSASHPDPFYYHGLTEIKALIEPRLNVRLIWVIKSYSFMWMFLFSVPYIKRNVLMKRASGWSISGLRNSASRHFVSPCRMMFSVHN